MVVGLAGVAQAACAPIAAPAPIPAIEEMKANLSAGNVEAAFKDFGVSEEAMAGLVADIRKFLPGPADGCAAIKRVWPSENFASELFLIQSQGTVFYFSISGLQQDAGFVILNVRYATDFDVFRGLIY